MTDIKARGESTAARRKHMVHYSASYKSVAGKQKSPIRKLPPHSWRGHEGKKPEKRHNNIIVMGKYRYVLLIVLLLVN